jgi:hypothetical protein
LILYLDTSSLVKLYVEEAHSESVRQWVTEAELVATCRVAYPETLSALTRRCRIGDLSRQDFDLLVECFTDECADLTPCILPRRGPCEVPIIPFPRRFHPLMQSSTGRLPPKGLPL